ncbi:MAG: hypothetical protein LUQ51_03175, partial [Methanothrix sp.]|nr:hypothetical protein [Methanothrix sp.]
MKSNQRKRGILTGISNTLPFSSGPAKGTIWPLIPEAGYGEKSTVMGPRHKIYQPHPHLHWG